jgi:hypothetical protein
MTGHRRLIAILCIAVVVFAGVLPGTAYVVGDALAPIGPLFGLVVCTVACAPADVPLPAAPAVSVLPSRAPPAT